MSQGVEPEVGLRERTRRTVRAELMTIGMNLFILNGYDQTTIEDISAGCGLSKRSFFRYFPSKEDLVFGNLELVGERIAARLGERPAAEPPWLALRGALDFLVTLNLSDPQRSLQLRRMLRDTPALDARRLEKQLRWRALLAAQLARRASPAAESPPPQLRDRAIAASALSCFDAAHDEWVATDAQASLADLLDGAMAAVAPLT
ncbi:MAG: transcriptional regulator, TetR family [Frankiales bacterium]|nr:transcriptional regulator, TetR family [Frankiales bacterium]